MVSSYRLKKDQNLRECNFDSKWLICAVENLNIRKVLERTSVVVFNIAGKQDQYQFSEITPDMVKGTIPRVAAARIVELTEAEKKSGRLLQAMEEDDLKKKSAKVELGSATDTGMKWYNMDVNPVTLELKENDLDKNDEFMQLKLTSPESQDSDSNQITIGDIETDKKPKPDDDKKEDTGEDGSGGGIFSGIWIWIIIILVILLIGLGIFFVLRRSKLQADAQMRQDEMNEKQSSDVELS